MSNYKKTKSDNIERGRDAQERLNLIKKRKKTQLIFIAVIACILMVSATLFVLYNNGVIGSDENAIGKTIGDQDDGFVYVNQLDINGGKLHYFEYTAENDKNVRYFLVEASDGSIRGAVDLCVKLHPDKSGWMLYEDYYIVCKDEMCSYPIIGIGTGQPGCCIPLALSVELVGDNVRISTEELEEASQYF